MKRLIIIAMLGLGLVPAMAQQPTVINDPNVELRPVNEFHGVSVSDGIDVYLSQGSQETVAASADEIRWRDRIRTEVKDGILKIWLDRKGFTWSIGGKKMRVYIGFTSLDKLSASGASNMYVDGVIAASSLNIDLSGASDFKGAINVGALKLDLSGASDAHITGTVMGATNVSSSGASDLKGFDLVTETCNAHASGASDIRITVNKELNVHASGASGIYYKGPAVIREMHSSGASSVSKKS
ncbi:head GIN domain-containing protein [Flavitalea sp. BT771]|uniref:head GIN domain-containing protein n=1 Tax=Flavitalea sp. BT771 TaxID=3063329 RepID=UPI0026E2ACFC|nr:head GIN domain-containing protein [Flavitalea sp. BT771]MDO6429818.1 head GIN domain-containing protein [Flavitalea sp. BT771]MDV6218054.1 head GIN domain-containing protein [Flavitalea sp. BT771]